MQAEAAMMASEFHLGYALAWEIGPLFVQSMVACEEGEKCPSVRSTVPARKMGEVAS
jgi:hypothetical protein